MLGTATITGVFYGSDGAPVAEADVSIVPKQKYVASSGDAAWVPRAVTGRTDATGVIGVMDGAAFTAGIRLAAGQYEMSVRKDDVSHNGVLNVDQDMVAAGSADLQTALGPAPPPTLVSAAQAARDKAREWASSPEDVEVETGLFSARHYAAKASTSGLSAGPGFKIVGAELRHDISTLSRG